MIERESRQGATTPRKGFERRARHSLLASWRLGGLLLPLATGCGGEEPPPKAPEPMHEEAAPRKPALKASSELGDVDPAEVTRAFKKLEDSFVDCQKRGLDRVEVLAGAGGSFRATMYVGPGGKVMAAGVATSTKDGDEKADCLSKALLKLKGLPSPGSWPAKVSFGL